METNTEAVEVTFFSLADYPRKNQTRNTEIREELNILNLKNKIFKS
jgi:hypothetical protein